MTSSYPQTNYPHPPFISLTNHNEAFLKTHHPLTNERAGFASFTYYANLPYTCPTKKALKIYVLYYFPVIQEVQMNILFHSGSTRSLFLLLLLFVFFCFVLFFFVFLGRGRMRGQNVFLKGQKSKNLLKMATLFIFVICFF